MRHLAPAGCLFLGLTLVLVQPSLAQEAAKKIAVPDDNALAAALRLVKEAYGDEYAAAKTVEKKRSLAGRLLQNARDSEKDRAGQYALLRLSRDISALAADVPGALQAINEIDKVFQIDALAMKVDVAAACAKKVHMSANHKAVAEHALPLLDEAIAEDAFHLTPQISTLALTAARAARDPQLLRKVQERIKEIDEVAIAYREARPAFAKLDQAPTDPQANRIAGKYACLVKGDWGKGVAMLAISDDPTLKSLAADDLRGAASPAAQSQLGDAWWDLAEKETGRAQQQMRAHAAAWYRQALPALAGLAKVRIEKRLQAVSPREASGRRTSNLNPGHASTTPTRGPPWG